MKNEILYDVPFEHANIDAAFYNGWITIDAENDIAKIFAVWYDEFSLVSINWITHTLKVKANA